MKKLALIIFLSAFAITNIAQDKLAVAQKAIDKKDYKTAFNIAKELLDAGDANNASRFLICFFLATFILSCAPKEEVKPTLPPVKIAVVLGADIVIAVDIAGDINSSQPEGTIETILQSITIMYSKLAAIQLSKADVVIKPKVGYIGSADFSKRHEAVLEGEKAALEALPKIQEIVNKLKQEGRLN